MQEDKQVLINDKELIEDEGDLCRPRPYVELSIPHAKSNDREYPLPSNSDGKSTLPGSNSMPQQAQVQVQERLSNCNKRFRDILRRRLFQLISIASIISQTCRFHRKLIISSLLVMISSSGCLIFFPLHLENISRHGTSDSYSACLTVSTVTTFLFLFNCIVLEIRSRRRGLFSESVLKPMISWKNVLKVGFCFGLSTITIFYSWEDDKVPCNLQDPLLGLVIIFAIITHAVSKWSNVGLKRTFALSAIAVGVFVSVDYPLVDHHRCRGYYYRNQPQDQWSWKVHLVWTLAFVVSIWLSTVAAFFLESSVPVPKVKHSRFYDQDYNAVKLKVIKGDNSEETSNGDSSYRYTEVLKSYKFNPYVNFPLSLISNAVLWFSVATWVFIAALFWTEFIPGFGKGVDPENLPDRLILGFRIGLTTGSSWCFFLSLFVFAHSFTYLIVLTRSPIVAIAIGVLGFPVIGLWWSFFQIRYSLFVWMPVFSGELICAFLGLILILGGCYYLLKFEILKPAKIKQPIVLSL